jgi:SAM-dependent methyltransferase
MMNQETPTPLLETDPTQYWDTVAAAWQDTHPQRLWRAYSDALHARLLRRWLPAAEMHDVLKTDAFDEAVSTGLFELLAARAQRVWSVDISAQLVRAAQVRHPALYATCADVRRLPFADGMFDLIVSNSTLDHFSHWDDLVAAVRELYRVLKPGGTLLLTLDNLANPVIALRRILPFRLLHRLGLVPYYVGVTCGPLRLRRLLQQAGFTVHHSSVMLHCPRVLAIPLAGLLEKYASSATQRRYIRLLLAWEHLAVWPVHFLTGHFLTVRALKPHHATRSRACF